MNLYNAHNWYWIVAGSARVWSSASLSYIEKTNNDYVVWCKRGNIPTMIESSSSLLQVLSQQVQPTVMAKGVQLMTDPGGNYPLTDAALTLMGNLNNNIIAGRPLLGGGDTFNFTDADGAQRAFSAAKFSDFVHACHNYVYTWTQALTTNLNGGKAVYPSRQIKI